MWLWLYRAAERPAPKQGGSPCSSSPAAPANRCASNRRGSDPTEADPFGWFADGPIRVSVAGVRHGQVRIGIQAPPALRILRDELPPRPHDPAPAALPGRRALARKLKILRILRRWSPESLARLAGLPVATIRRGEGRTNATH